MKNVVTFLLTVSLPLLALVAEAKKVNYSFPDLVYISDVIVTGSITSVLGDTSYIFEIDRVVKGNPEKRINVKMFRNWTCDIRWKKPITGQSLFLCLKRDNINYTIVGGSDGEMFILGNKLRLFNTYNSYVSKIFPEEKSPKLTDVIRATIDVLSCYSLVNNGIRNTYIAIKKPVEIEPLRKMNGFSTWLFDLVDDKLVL